MPAGRPGNYPYPPAQFKDLEQVRRYQADLYRSLLDNDSRGEYFRDRRPPTDLTDLIVRPEWYGAKGDGATDDTVAIQAAADALEAGQMLVFTPGKTYRTNTIYINTSNVWVGAIGGKATLSVSTSMCYGVLVHGGTISSANRTLAYFNATYVLSDYNDSRLSGVTVENLKITAYTGTKNTSIALMWADDCNIINCETEEGDGNGYDIRQCRRPFLCGCKSTSPAAYNVFCFQCAHAVIENNDFSGATSSAVSLKHRYNDEPCNHIVRNNRVTSSNGFYVSGGYSLGAETAPYYTGNWERVENILVEGNRFKSTSSDTYCPNIAMCSYAFNWIVRDNVFDGGDIASGNYPLYIGTLGDWYTNGNLETYGENHVICGNVFKNMTINRACDVGCSCVIEDNVFDCGVLMAVTDNATYRLHNTIRLSVNNNILTQLRLSVSGSSGLVVSSAYVEHLGCYNNVIVFAPTDYLTNSWVEGLRSSSPMAIISGNKIKISAGSASHLSSYGVILNGAASVVTGNDISVGSGTTKVGIITTSNATADNNIVAFNALNNLSESGGSIAIQTAVRTVCWGNKYLGTWGTTISDTSGGSSISLGTRRIAYATSAPSSGGWTTGDIVFKLNAATGDAFGWYCTASGTPGTWGVLAPVGYVVQDVRATASPTFVTATLTTLPSYANDAAAGVGGLTSGMLYTETGTDPLRIAVKT